MQPSLIVIASCTQKKKGKIAAERHLRAVKGESQRERLSDWGGRLPPVGDTKVRDLYVGDHWSVARGACERLRERDSSVELWASSAGYGLVHENELIAPYSATFSKGQPDSVRDEPGEWWRGLAKSVPLSSGRPRTIQQLAAQYPNAALVTVTSPAYLDAMGQDLLEAKARLRKPDSLLIISSGPGSAGELAPNLITSTARLRAKLGGALPALHARLARYLLETLWPDRLSATQAQRTVEEFSSDCEPLVRHERQPLSDPEVVDFIRKALTKNPLGKQTRLLRELRDGGRACEQSRFRELFLSVAPGAKK
jgi:hypothetical protein